MLTAVLENCESFVWSQSSGRIWHWDLEQTDYITIVTCGSGRRPIQGHDGQEQSVKTQRYGANKCF